MVQNKDLTLEVYRTAIDLELNDEQAFHAALFINEFMPHELEMQTYYMKEVLMRFKKGSMIAYADWQARQSLATTYQMVLEHGGLFMNWYNSQED